MKSNPLAEHPDEPNAVSEMFVRKTQVSDDGRQLIVK
jgi:hypothetical protein